MKDKHLIEFQVGFSTKYSAGEVFFAAIELGIRIKNYSTHLSK